MPHAILCNASPPRNLMPPRICRNPLVFQILSPRVALFPARDHSPLTTRVLTAILTSDGKTETTMFAVHTLSIAFLSLTAQNMQRKKKEKKERQKKTCLRNQFRAWHINPGKEQYSL